jgi:hypothetical protein
MVSAQTAPSTPATCAARPEPSATAGSQSNDFSSVDGEREQVDDAPNLVDRHERAGEIERQTSPWIRRRIDDPYRWQRDIPGTAWRCGAHELEERRQTPRYANRFHGAKHDPIAINPQ